MQLDLCPESENVQIKLFTLTADHVTDEYISWLNDPDINKYLESRFIVHTVETTRNFVGTMLNSPDNLFLGIWSKQLDKHVGNIKLGLIDQHHHTGEIGILLGDRNTWGKGVGSLAINMLSKIAHKQLSIRKVTAGCYASNIGSKRAFEKAGFEVEAIRKGQFLANGKPEDLILMARFLNES